MREITEHTDEAWRSETKFGDQRPVVRATIQKMWLQSRPYNTDDAPGGDYDNERSRKGHFRNFVFGPPTSLNELRNIRTCSWSRSVDRDVAECTLTLLNTDILPYDVEDDSDDFEHAGLMSPTRGDSTAATARWGYNDQTGWNDLIIPDRVVKTYEGYGGDVDVVPGLDPDLYLTGTWMIDEATYTATGDITIAMRDLGRLLIDHICFPPVIPFDDYPLAFSTIRSDSVEGRAPTGGKYTQPGATAKSSNELYIGEGIIDKPTYVGAGGGVEGHKAIHGMRGGNSTYWLSTGQLDQDDVVWWQQDFTNPQDMSAVRVHPFGGPYRVYISVMVGGEWVGKKKIPYRVTTEDVDLGAGIKFVATDTIDKGLPYDIVLRRRYRNVQKVRVTFTKLRRLMASNYPWRAGLREIKVYTGSYAAMGFDNSGLITRPVGNIRDFTDIVKWACAWAGFYWPQADAENKIYYSRDEPPVHYEYDVGDPILPKGRVWGCWQKTGTAPIADLTAENFDKQPLLEVIQYVRNITNFLFFIDEAGGPTWRMPNLYELGNWVSPHHLLPRRNPERSLDIVEIDEEETLNDYRTRLSSRNARERIFVGDGMGKFGATVRGHAPVKAGLMRIAGWTDQHFDGKTQALVAADMIAARQMFDWRRSKAVINGNPAIQCDDQVRFWERTTNETFYHYVIGIDSTLDMDAGTWEYNLETHWLGEDPEDAWVFNPDELDAATQQYLNALGGVDDD